MAQIGNRAGGGWHLPSETSVAAKRTRLADQNLALAVLVQEFDNSDTPCMTSCELAVCLDVGLRRSSVEQRLGVCMVRAPCFEGRGKRIDDQCGQPRNHIRLFRLDGT